MKVSIRLLDDYEAVDGQVYASGTFLEVDPRLAKELVDLEVAEEKTPEQFAAEKQAAIERDRRKQLKSKRDASKSDIRVVGERAEADPTGGFKSLGELASHIYKAGHNGAMASEKLLRWQKTAGHMNEGDDQQGGYLVPPQYSNQLLQNIFDTGQLMSRARRIPMQTNRISIPAINETSRVDGSRAGGASVYWTAEAAQKTASKPLFRQITLSLNKVAGLIYASDELLEDSPISVEPLINDIFARELKFVVEDAMINGTGAGQPLGILNAPCLVTQAIEVGQDADTIVYNNITKMWSRLISSSRPNAVWIINQDVEPELYNLTIAVGTGGAPAYMPAGGLSQSPYGTLMGRPVLPAEYCPTLGDVGDIILADWSQYLLATKTPNPQMDSSIHLRFDYDETTFRFVWRADGQPWWSSALTPNSGSGNTLSPFVVLAERA